jgi:hypothetical protein
VAGEEIGELELIDGPAEGRAALGTNGRQGSPSMPFCRATATVSSGSRSCQTTTWPSAVTQRSISMALAPSLSAAAYEGRVFSAASLGAPRWPTTRKSGFFFGTPWESSEMQRVSATRASHPHSGNLTPAVKV